MFFRFMPKVFLLALVAMPVAVFAASESAEMPVKSGAMEGGRTRILNRNIDKWIVGNVTNIDAAKGDISVNGTELPLATKHAELRQELRQKLATAKPDKREAIAKQERSGWKEKLAAAKNEKRSAASEFKLKAPASGNIAIVDQKDFEKNRAMRHEAMAAHRAEKAEAESENDVVEAYESPSNASAERSGMKESAKLSLNDIKKGDKVAVGLDSKTNTVYSIVKEAPVPASSQEKGPSNVR